MSAMLGSSRLSLAAVAVALVVVAGCKKKEEEGGSGSVDTTTSATAAASAPRTTATTGAPPTTTAAPPKPATNDADANALRGCCAAIRSAAASQASTADKDKYTSAAATCDGIVEVVRKGATTRSAALGSIRAALRGGTLPSACN